MLLGHLLIRHLKKILQRIVKVGVGFISMQNATLFLIHAYLKTTKVLGGVERLSLLQRLSLGTPCSLVTKLKMTEVEFG